MTDQAISVTDIQAGPHRRKAPGVLAIQKNVMYALILHDVKSRFFGNMWGYVVTIIWPGIHLAILIAVHTFNLTDNYGDSVVLFAATGVMPFIGWNYVSRLSMMAQTVNRSLLNYPIVNPLDLILSRAFMEIVTVFIVLVALCVFMVAIDINIMPRDPGGAALGMLSAIFLGSACGIFCGVIVAFFPLLIMMWMLIVVIAHLTSGIIISVERFPPAVQKVLAYNPLLHSIEWIRVSYWNDYPAHLLSKPYVLYFSGVTMFIGLALERMLRKNKGRR